MSSRLAARASILARALAKRIASPSRQSPSAPRRVLIAHDLLLGDTVMLTALIAKLRAQFPSAEIVMTVPPAIAPLYQHRPFGVRVLPFSPRNGETVRALFNESSFDLAVVPGDNRYSWLAQAMDARWITAFAADRPAYKNWLVDEAHLFPDMPGAWGDMAAGLIAGPAPVPFTRNEWKSPEFAPFAAPNKPYCVLHVGASSPLKLWPAENWRRLAVFLESQGLKIVWSAGRGEEGLVTACDPTSRLLSYAGKLDLAQLWHLIEYAKLLIAPDTGVAHLAKAIGTPTVALFGPGPTRIYGAGDFWKSMPFQPIVLDDLPARNQATLFHRELSWLRGDGGKNARCAEPRALYGSGLKFVEEAAARMLE